MWGYDGQTFDTVEEFTAYLQQKFGNSYLLNVTSINDWGKDLLGNQVYLNGVAQTGDIGAQYAAEGFQEAQNVMDAYTANPTQFSADTFEQLAKVKQTKEAVIAGTTYSNDAIQLGTNEAQGGQILTATKPIVSDNGTVFNRPSVTQVEQIEDPTVPGTFSYLATLKALGWLPLPTWTAAAAPLLGVGLGVGLYDLNPELWEKISRTLLPFCYDDNTGIPKIPISVDSNGTVHTPEDAIEALRQLLIEEGAYGDGSIDIDHAQTIEGNTIEVVTPLKAFTVSDGISWKIRNNSTETIEDLTNTDPVYVFYPYGNTTDYGNLWLCSKSPFQFYVNVNGNRYLRTSSAHTYGTKTYYTANPSTGQPTTTSLLEAGITQNANQIGVGSGGAGNSYEQSIVFLFGDTSGGSGIEGVTPESGATYPTDTTKNLAELYPDWYNNGIDILNNPVATLIEDGVERWVPLSLSDTNFSSDTNNTSSTQTQTDAQTGTNTSNAQLNQIAQALQDLTKTLTGNGTLPKNPTIPSDPTGNTPTPTPPVITGAGSDLIAIYNPTKAQIKEFNQFLWDLDPTNLTNWKKVIANPIDAVISLHMIYVTPVTGETRNIKCGYIETDVPSVIVTNQYKEIDCGTVAIGEYFHNIWDYIATHIEIYLPFVGIVPLHVSDVMNSTIRVRYRVDVYTGACLAQIIVYKGNYSGVLYTYAGNCAVPLPLTSGSFTGVFSTLLSMGASAITAGVTGGAMTPAIAAGVTGMRHAQSIQQNVQRSGSIGSNVGALGIRTPYVIITRKVPLDAHLYETQYGFPANKTVVLGNMHGYTRVKDIHLAGIPCTDDELEMIERLLKDGVIIN